MPIEEGRIVKTMGRKLDESKPSKETRISRYSLSEDDEKNSKLREDNAYLHDNVD